MGKQLNSGQGQFSIYVPSSKKKSKTKIYLSIVLVAILVAASAAIVYYTTASSGSKSAKVGVHIGDTFTYSIKGTASLGQLRRSDPYRILPL